MTARDETIERNRLAILRSQTTRAGLRDELERMVNALENVASVVERHKGLAIYARRLRTAARQARHRISFFDNSMTGPRQHRDRSGLVDDNIF